jgi:type VI secretion system protein VasJ
MKSLRHDTLRAIPAPDAQGRTRIEPPRADQRALLKRLYLQQNWAEMLETADSTFSRGANHLWLDLQWYIHQALTKSGKETLADIVAADLKGLLSRLSGLETLAFSDGTPFADEVTLNWIQQSVLDTVGGWGDNTPSAPVTSGNDDILALEPEAVALADSEGPDAALGWLQTRPGMTTDRQKWLLRLLMGRIAEQYGKNDLAVHLFAALGERAREVTLSEWEPELLFEVQARHLKLLRLKAGRSEADKARLTPVMDQLLVGLIAVDPARAAVLCG